MKVNLRKYSRILLIPIVTILAAVGGILYANNMNNEPEKIHIAGCEEAVIPPSYYEGMTSSEAEAKATDNGARYRDVSVDGEPRVITQDYIGCGRRVNVTLVHDVVTKAEYY